MEFISLNELRAELKENDKEIYIQDVFNLERKISKAIIVSAYTDLSAISDLVEILKTKNYSGEKITLQIYLDKGASRYKTENKVRFQDIMKDINDNNIFCKNSGIFLVTSGALFHSKCYIFESRANCHIYIGSLNFTYSGMRKNEEVLMHGEYKISSQAIISNFAKNIKENYINVLRNNSFLVNDLIENMATYSSIREFMLDARLYYEYKESDIFSLPLNLPAELREVTDNAVKHELQEAKYNNNVSIKKALIALKLISDVKKEKKEKSMWKKYCIQTCYGYWVPNIFVKHVEYELEKKTDKQGLLEYIKEQLSSNKNIVIEYVSNFIDKYYVEKAKNGDYRGDDEVTSWCKEWEDTEYRNEKIGAKIDKILAQLENDEICKRLASGVDYTNMIDLWSQNDEDEFYRTFSLSIQYIIDKEKYTNQNTSNAVINQLWDKLALYNEDDIDIIARIDKWFKNQDNTSCNLLDEELSKD